MLAVVCSWQLAASANAQPIATAPGISSIDGTDCIASLSEEKQPSQDSNNSPASPSSPDSSSDLDDSDVSLDDLIADTSTRNDHDTPYFSVAGLDAVTLRAPGVTPVLLLPVPCFYCLHEHIRERAPPSLA